MKTLSIDTNILVRLLVVDHAEQSEIAENLVATSRLFVLWTVLLETEWVLRKIIKVDVLQINDLFRSLSMGDFIEIERPEVFTRVLDLHLAGMDFADAAHVCLTAETTTFVTFDRDLVRRAKKLIPHASVALAT